MRYVGDIPGDRIPEILPPHALNVRAYWYEETIGGRIARTLIPHPNDVRLPRRERDRLARAAFEKLARSAG